MEFNSSEGEAVKAVKRVEIVTDSLELSRIVEVVERAGASGYTMIRDVAGKGGHGIRAGDELTDVFKNCYVVTACTEDQARAIVEAVRPILKRTGGICLVSDAQWVTH
jgi:nitrogen regulatory protein PII